MNFVKELEWRGMLQDVMPGTEELLDKEFTTAYLGIDPTADSLHIGHLAGVMMLKRFQQSGHKPIALIGGATGMIGDPSGKSQERNLLDEETLRHNQEAIKKQLSKFIDFSGKEKNSAIMVNNYDWMKEFSFLDFIRDIGKSLTVNYMMAKDSVKSRMSRDGENNDVEGLSFTEFTYQLVQGYDFLHLYQNNNCKLQIGGSDQWGNITTGTELIRRKAGGKAFALTWPLITKADGGKFGKTEKGNIWLDPKRTSSYEFYQFWLNTSDEDAEKYIKIFTIISKEEIEKLVLEHKEAPNLRLLQKTLAKEATIMAHSEKDYETAIEASAILFGNGTKETLEKFDENTFLSVFKGVPQFKVEKNIFNSGIAILDLLAEKTNILASKGEARRLMKDNGLSINQEKEQNSEKIINTDYLINDKFILIRQGKKNYFLIVAE
ncbi:MAG: tyrosine--tRNA ligase [Bacteroidales bacterium]|nr:tyrosine--tRNA ligase [Bacteroidales bacterium]MBN2755795.1 tyrosine--tRNA ligase [Bacteroidales bacterium]